MASTTIIEASSTVGSFMLPGMASPEQDALGRVVRFDNECVLIPEAVQKAKKSLVLTRSYSLPLWRRKGYPQSDSDAEDPSSPTAQIPSPEDSRVVLKVPIPLFRRKSSRSPTRGRSVSSSPVIQKTPPSCLVHRSPSSSPTISRSMPLSSVRRPSLPIYQRRKDELTVPLRACCEACERIIEESLKEGENWEEKFSRGAKRRRSASLDRNDTVGLHKLPSHARSSGFSQEFSALSASLDSNIRESSRSAFALTVDEVDKRRKSYDFNTEPLEPFIAALPPSPGGLTSSNAFSFGSPYSGKPRYPRSSRPHDRDVSSGSTASSSSGADELLLPDILDSRHRLRSSPIEEEDEAQLFPLPSPRRSPSGTPSPSPSPRISPVPSPNASTTCLPAENVYKLPSGSPSNDDMASKLTYDSSQESLLKASLSRKPQAAYLVTPRLSTPRKVSPGSLVANLPRSPSPLASSPVIDSPAMVLGKGASKRISTHGLKIPIASTAEKRASSSASVTTPNGPHSSPSFMAKDVRYRSESAKESPSTAGHQTSSFASTPLVPLRPSNMIMPNETIISGPTPRVPLRLSTISMPASSPIPIPSTTHSRQVSSPSHSHPQAQPGQMRTTSASTSPSSPTSPRSQPGSPVVGSQRRKLSFTLPFIKAGEALRDASVDVLKGVSSMGGGGMVGNA